MKKSTKLLINLGLMAALILVILLESMFLPSTSMIFPVIRKGAIYALVAVSMNLTNGFTGLFSLGQAGFMLIGAYTYAIFTIPDADRASVYMYFNGGAIHANLPVKEFPKTGKVEEKDYCKKTGLLASPSCKETAKGYYKKSAMPAECTACGGGSVSEVVSGVGEAVSNIINSILPTSPRSDD